MNTYDADVSIHKVMATGDTATLNLLEQFMDVAQDAYSGMIEGKKDSVRDAMPALYALNRHLLSHYPDIFPHGFFVGTEHEVGEHIRKLLVSVFSQGKGGLKGLTKAYRGTA